MTSRKKYVYSDVEIPSKTLRLKRQRLAQSLAAGLEAAAAAAVNAANAAAAAVAAAAAQAAEYDQSGMGDVDSDGCGSSGECGECNSIPTDFEDGPKPSLSTCSEPCIESNDADVTVQLDTQMVSRPTASSSVCQTSSDDGDSSSDKEDDTGEGDSVDEEDMETEASGESPSTLKNQADYLDLSASMEHESYMKSPLCESTETSKGDALLMCLAFGLRHKLPWAGIVDILQMINCLFGKEVIKATKYFFQKYMDSGKGKVTYHLYCPYCNRYLGIREEVHTSNVGCRCGKTLKDVSAASTFFLSLNLQEQIKTLLKDDVFVEALQYRFTRKKRSESAYEDLFDGEVYKSFSAPGEILSYWYNMSYMLNTDGFPVGGKSRKQTCWPIYVQINEVPPSLRSRFMLLAGIYVGKKDPNMNIFMYPFVEEANDLSRVGIDWQYKNKKMNSKIIPLCICVDTPTRSKILNTSAFSGEYGCSLCYTNPTYIPKSGSRYTIETYRADERTHDEILEDAEKAYQNFTLVKNKKKRRVRGLKGPSPIHNLCHLDLVKGVRPDTMHSMLLGNAKHITSVLHDAVGRHHYIGSEVRLLAINMRLQCIKPPSSVFRSNINFNNFTSLKAKDWRSWILFFAIPCLLGIIPEENVCHLSLLSSALHIVLSQSITNSDLDQAHILALRYVFLFQQLYGKHEMVFNIHLLMHLRKNIEYLGPAWTNVAFGFESANKDLLQLKEGASSIAKEIATKYLTFQSLPQLCEKYCSSQKTLKFCQNLSGRPLLKTANRVGGAVLVGKGKKESLTAEEVACLAKVIFLYCSKVQTHERLMMNGIQYCVASYSRATMTDDSFISVQLETKARIQKIILIEREYALSIMLLVREILVDEEPIFKDEFGKHSHIKKILKEGRLLAIRPEDISGQCVAMFLESGNFICDVPYGCYGDT